MIDVLSIASDGLLSADSRTLAIASRGYLSTFVIVVIDVGKRRVDAGEGFGVLITDDAADIRKKAAIIRQEDNEIMLIIQIFVTRWL